MKLTNIYIIKVPEGKEREKGIKNVFEKIIADKFPNLKTETDIHIEKKQKVSNNIYSNRLLP